MTPRAPHTHEMYTAFTGATTAAEVQRVVSLGNAWCIAAMHAWCMAAIQHVTAAGDSVPVFELYRWLELRDALELLDDVVQRVSQYSRRRVPTTLPPESDWSEGDIDPSLAMWGLE